MWTMSNTEGFSQTDLDVINDVRDAIARDAGDDADAGSIDDAINNAWFAGNTRAELERATRKRLGLQ